MKYCPVNSYTARALALILALLGYAAVPQIARAGTLDGTV